MLFQRRGYSAHYDLPTCPGEHHFFSMSFIKDLRIIRLSRKPEGLMKSHLPVHSQLHGYHWQFRTPAQAEALSSYCDAFTNAQDACAPGVIPLKVSNSRRVLRVISDESRCIVKGFSYTDSLGKQFYRHRLYALDEALGLMLAGDRGVSVPRVIAYGEQRAGIKRLASMVVMEDVENAFHPVDVFRGDRSSGLSIEGVLKRVTPLIQQLYEAGCNHIDVHGTSFLIHKSNSESDKVIDFQFAVFHNQPSGRILAHQLAHFSRASFKDVDSQLLDDWASSVINELEPAECNALFSIYQECSRKPVASAYKRMSLKP